MRGSPLLEWFCFAIVWGILLIPLLRVSGGMDRSRASEAAVALPPVETPSESVWLRVAFSEAPAVFSLIVATGVIWSETDAGNEMEQLVDMAINRAVGPALDLEVRWTTRGRRAVEVVVEPLEGPAWRTTVWINGDGTRERVVFK
ncbi:MAG TPA: hypothetical protein DCS43_02590 [Verrucomicrobia bacterium]|nr:hypothetical protein [Verrucomicrobiota bacterium]